MKEKVTAGSPFFRARRSHCIPKASKDVNVHLFIRSRNSCKLYQQSEFPTHFEATMYFIKLLPSMTQNNCLNSS